jgi:hypothetical protein
MKLIYRGASYEYNQASLEVNPLRHYQDVHQRCTTLAEASYPLAYRGVQYTTAEVAQNLAAVSVSHTPQLLTYRGVHYLKNANEIVGFTRPAKASLAPKTLAPALLEAASAHHENLRRSLQHRLEVAKRRGDETLVNQLEAESRQLAL